MIYQNYQTIANWNEPFRIFAEQAFRFIGQGHKAQDHPLAKGWMAWYEQISMMGFTHQRPEFLIQPVVTPDGQSTEIKEEIVSQSPFCHLIRFCKVNTTGLPKILLAAPMSGHFATLLRSTVQTLVQDHDVYLTDWLNVRDIPLSAGEFDLDAYIDELIGFQRILGPGAHMMGVCQPTVACLVAASIMAEAADPCTPASLTLMAGPIDTRINPTKVNELAMTKPIAWFEKNLISKVPMQFAGKGRSVYPGFLQLTAFMSMNTERHKKSFRDLYALRKSGEHEKADAIKDFYKEYFAIMDLAAPFYLQTVENVFQKHLLPQGAWQYKGRSISPGALKKTFLLTVEGERDDICGIGQTLAAQDLCTRIPPYMKTHHLQAGVGHYGVFSGKKWHTQIYPVVRSMIQSTQ